MPEFRIGTSASTAAGWEGSFYPAGMKPADYLTYYATKFNTVETDSTFYRTPAPKTVKAWADRVPKGLLPSTPSFGDNRQGQAQLRFANDRSSPRHGTAFDATMKTNIYAPFWIIEAALPHLQPGSCIIGNASEQAYDPAANLYDYAQTKAATMNYVKSLAKQLGPKGIRVNGVAPGPIWTPLQVPGGATQDHLIHFGETYPLRRAGQPTELASIYVQLAANDASYTTGNIYGAGGGGGQP
jgi:NAD(P)-dependent dehydrogenase (short-subunit alcohol dehydrogenase family)